MPGTDDSSPPPRRASKKLRQRIGRHPLGLIVVGAIVAFAALGIGRPLLGTTSFNGADSLLTYAPWRDSAPEGFVAQMPCVGDTIDSVIPTTTEFRGRLLKGDVAEWNSYAAGGTPLGATPNSAVFSPLSTPALILSPWLAPAYVKLLEIFVGILGMYLFLRQIALARPAALLGGLLFVSSGFLVTWTNWPQSRTATCIPWLFWAIERFVRKRTLVAAVPIPLVVAALLLGGFPAVTGYALYAAVPYLGLRALSVTRWRLVHTFTHTALGLVAIGLGVALAAFQVLPFVSWLQDVSVSRAQDPDNHLQMLSLVTTAAPKIFGSCTVRTPYFGANNIIEANAFIGAAALVLIGVALFRGPSEGVPRGIRGYFAAGSIVTILLGWWGHFPLRLAQKLPVFSNNPVFRIRSILGFFLAVLAAIGYDRLARSPRPRDRHRTLAEAGGWALAAAVAADLLFRLDHTYSSNPLFHLRLLVLPLVAGGLTFAIAVALGTARVAGRPALRMTLLAIVPIVVAVESIVFVSGFWPQTNRDEFYPETSVQRYLAANDAGGSWRYMGAGRLMPGSVNVYYGLSTPTGHAFTTTEWLDLLKTVDPATALSDTFTGFHATLSTERLSSPILDRLAVRFLITDPRTAVYGRAEPVTAPTGNLVLRAGRSVDAALPPGPLRAVSVDITGDAGLVRPAWLKVRVVDAAGRVLAVNRRRIDAEFHGGNFAVALAGEALPGGPLVARITLDAPGGDLSVRAAGSSPSVGVVRPVNDGLRLAFAGPATVWERQHALPRVRWASNVVVEPDRSARLALLASAAAPNNVVFDEPVPAASGKPARVHVVSQGGDALDARVDAAGAGYLVVADSLTRGWTATVDGHRTPLLTADHATSAVRVPSGTHDVRLRYVPVHQRAGLALSGLTAGLLGGIILGSRVARRRDGSRVARRAQTDAQTLARTHGHHSRGNASAHDVEHAG